MSWVTTSPTAGAVYTNNGATFTVTAVSISGWIGTITASYPSGAPLSSGTLTKSSGTGDASITYSAVYDEILNAITTATVVVANKILFARANNIYEIDTWSYVVQTSKDSNNQPVTLTYGHTVKYMYQFNDTLQVVATHNNNTYFYTYSISATATALQLIQRYKVPVIGYKCIDAIGSNGFIRWISTQWIHIFSGNNQFVKALNTIPSAQRIFSTSARMAIYKDLVTIADGTDIWEYGHILPGYPDILTRRTSINTISCVSEQWFSTGTWWTTRIETILTWSSYRQTGNIVTLPYDASIFSEVKDNLKFRLWYILPSGSYAGTQCSIVVGVQTNTMEQNNTVTYATVATITDKTKNRQTISLQEINTALNTAGVSPEWWYIRFKITLNAGNETWAIYAKTPQIFDFYLSHDNIKNDI